MNAPQGDRPRAFPGIDPRFTEVGGAADQVAGIVFGLLALLFTIVFVVLGLRFFRSDVLIGRPILRNAIRYGTVGVWISFGVGILMSINAGRESGASGDLMVAHALGVHGIQAVPLLGLVAASVVPRASRWLHFGGVGWIAACTAALLQALAGGPPFEVSAFSMVMLVGLVAYAVAGTAGLLSWRRLAVAR